MPIINDIPAFQAFLAANSESRILALCGAGLSAASGLPTFRGAGGLWRNHDATRLATPHAFKADPALVWLFYAYRRHMALEAKPNPAHHALAALARKRKEFLCLTQNVDSTFPSPILFAPFFSSHPFYTMWPYKKPRPHDLGPCTARHKFAAAGG